jgi:hypothetical protein
LQERYFITKRDGGITKYLRGIRRTPAKAFADWTDCAPTMGMFVKTDAAEYLSVLVKSGVDATIRVARACSASMCRIEAMRIAEGL